MKSLVEHKRQADRSFNYQNMSEKMRVPKSYLSKVVNKKAHLNQDQLFLACDFLGLTNDKRYYMELLLDHAKTGLNSRKKVLKGYIDSVRKKELKSQNVLEVKEVNPESTQYSQYFLNPLHRIIHVSLTIPKYANRPKKLAQDLMISEERVDESIQLLKELEIIEFNGVSWDIKIANLHLDQDSYIFKPSQNQLKAFGNWRKEQAQDPEDKNFTVVFSADQKCRDEVKAKFLGFISEVQKSVEGSENKQTFQMNFDLFSWTQELGESK